MTATLKDALFGSQLIGGLAMHRRKGAALLASLVLITVAVLLTEGPVQGAKPGAYVQLSASFRDAVDDTVRNDTDEPYLTTSGGGVSAWITTDAGDLFFKIEHHSGRSVQVLFPQDLTDPTLGSLPDTSIEPVDFFRLQTRNADAFGTANRVDLLKMTRGVWMPVRLWTTICTTERHYYLLNYSKVIGKISGVVQVMASDLNGGAGGEPDGITDTWDIEPLSSPEDHAHIWKQNETGKTAFYDFGQASMPFRLTLKRR